MKANIHPTWNTEAVISCACGNSFKSGSTQESIRVDICAKCHPFYTGTQKFVDTLGQVERFQKKTEAAQEKSAAKRATLEARRARMNEQKGDKPSLKDLLLKARKDLNS
jgi:large subunit ribosomal protein L31